MMVFIECRGKHGPIFIRPGDVVRLISQEDGTTVRLKDGGTEFVLDDAGAVRRNVEQSLKEPVVGYTNTTARTE